MKPIAPFVRNLFIFLSFFAVSAHMAFMINLVVKQAQLQTEVVELRAALIQAENEQLISSQEFISLKQKEVCIPGSEYRKPVPLMSIVYVEAFNGQTIFYLSNGKQLSCEYGLDKTHRELLKSEDFCRINRTYVVNRPHFTYYTPRQAKKTGYTDFGKWGIVVNTRYGQIKLSQSGRDRCYPNGKDIEYCF